MGFEARVDLARLCCLLRLVPTMRAACLVLLHSACIVLLLIAIPVDNAKAARTLDDGWVERFDSETTVKALRLEGWSIPRARDLAKQFPSYIRLEKIFRILKAS